MKIVLSVICILALFGCSKGASTSHSGDGFDCTDFQDLQTGTVTITVSGNQASVDWTNNLSVFSDSLSVSLSGPASVTSATTKPAVFTGLASGSWSATITYSKSGCSAVTSTKAFSI